MSINAANHGGKMRKSSTSTRHIFRTLTTLALAASSLAISSPASAAADSHCVGAAGNAVTKPSPPTCFSTFAQAVAFATGGEVILASDATTAPRAQVERMNATAAETKVLGISFMDAGFRGNTYTHTAPTGCDAHPDIDYYFQFPTAWNDRTSSAESYAGCGGYYWEAGNGTSGSGAWAITDWTGGPLSDRATFIEWF